MSTGCLLPAGYSLLRLLLCLRFFRQSSSGFPWHRWLPHTLSDRETPAVRVSLSSHLSFRPHATALKQGMYRRPMHLPHGTDSSLCFHLCCSRWFSHQWSQLPEFSRQLLLSSGKSYHNYSTISISSKIIGSFSFRSLNNLHATSLICG